ncbi:MAG TPA: UDP-2,3-diacylglucosamine diphosphatase, partial [Thiobacillus sp.]|nr:UDP-2,3-diacylglucosamine diphosphatase [Thiobacillus sp.]
MLNRVTNLLRARQNTQSWQPADPAPWPAGQIAAPTAGSASTDARTPRHHRTLWISDIHLGTPGCQARYLIDFLKHNESDTLYLVGDIIDGWQLRRGWYW